MKLRFTRPALSDLDELLEYIASRSPRGARRVHLSIKAAIDLLLEFPHIGASTSDPEIRRTRAHPYPYLIFYEATADEIIIHAVRHAARDPSGMPGAE